MSAANDIIRKAIEMAPCDVPAEDAEQELRAFLMACLSVGPPPPPRDTSPEPDTRRWRARTTATVQPKLCWRHPYFILFGDAPLKEQPLSRDAPSRGRRSYSPSNKNGRSMLCINKWSGELFEHLEADPMVSSFMVDPVGIRLKSRRLFKPTFYARRNEEDWFVDSLREKDAQREAEMLEERASEVVSFGINYEIVTDQQLSRTTRAANVRTIRRARFAGFPAEGIIQTIVFRLREGRFNLGELLAAEPSLKPSDIHNAIALRHVLVDLDQPLEEATLWPRDPSAE